MVLLNRKTCRLYNTKRNEDMLRLVLKHAVIVFSEVHHMLYNRTTNECVCFLNRKLTAR